MKKNKLNWFDRMMIGVTFAEMNTEEPDLTHLSPKGSAKNTLPETKEDEYESFDPQTVPVR